MIEVYFDKRSKMTAYANQSTEYGYRAYRSRGNCKCKEGRNRRNIILLINCENRLEFILIKCRECERKEVANGTI